jgi:hypothetical protein
METFQALAVGIVAILPGALYTWAFEREVGNWGAGLSDRLYRFVGFSALFHAVLAYPEFLIWRSVLHVGTASTGFHDRLSSGEQVAWWLFLIPVAYVAAPTCMGFLTARSAAENGRLARALVGRNPPPRAWDALFWREPSFLIRLKLRDDTWVGGLFGEGSSASGYPEPKDLLLEETYDMLPDGSFAAADGREQLVPLGSRILVSWDEVRFMEVFPLEADESGADDTEES